MRDYKKLVIDILKVVISFFAGTAVSGCAVIPMFNF